MARVTEGLLYNKADSAVNRTRSKMIENQEQAITGKRVNKPSDDPQGTVRAMDLKTKIDRNEQAIKNMEIANSYLSVTDSALAELSGLLTRAKELAIQMSNSTNQSADAMRSVQAEVDQLYYQALQIGNTRVGEHYIFAGYQTERPPFDEDGNFYGDLGSIEIEVQPGQRVPLNVAGLKPFVGLDDFPSENNKLKGPKGSNGSNGWHGDKDRSVKKTKAFTRDAIRYPCVIRRLWWPKGRALIPKRTPKRLLTLRAAWE